MKKYFKVILIGFLIILITSYSTNSYILMSSKDISNLFLDYFSYLPISDKTVIKDIVICIMHNLFIIYVFSSYIKDEIHINGHYIFTRTSKKEKWIIKEYGKIFKYLTIYYFIEFILFFIVSKLKGAYIEDFSHFYKSIIILFIFNVLTSYILILISNTVSLFSNSFYGYISSIILLISDIIALNAFYNFKNFSIINFLPLSQNLILFKKTSFINQEIFNKTIENYSFNISIIIMISFIIILYYISSKIIKKIEIL